ncbi:leucine Rich Repeat family protein [Pelomyxa schiedti]|nr:leucine Rich Repeat family protein [Pelomyxa schiedti]
MSSSEKRIVSLVELCVAKLCDSLVPPSSPSPPSSSSSSFAAAHAALAAAAAAAASSDSRARVASSPAPTHHECADSSSSPSSTGPLRAHTPSACASPSSALDGGAKAGGGGARGFVPLVGWDTPREVVDMIARHLLATRPPMMSRKLEALVVFTSAPPPPPAPPVSGANTTGGSPNATASTVGGDERVQPLFSYSGGGIDCLDLSREPIGVAAARRVAHACGASLRSLSVASFRAMSPGNLVDVVAPLSGLVSLVLDGTATESAVLQKVAESCPHLESLSVRECDKITDAGVIAVTRGCPGLYALNLHGCSLVTDASLSAIAEFLPKLEILSLKLCKSVTDTGVKKICQSCSQLRALNVKLCHRVGDTSLGAMTTTQLQTLNVSFCEGVSATSLIRIAQACSNSLTKLSMQYIQPPYGKLADIAREAPNLTYLHALSVSGSQDDTLLAQVTESCPDITRFYFGSFDGNGTYSSGVTDFGISAMAHNLQSLQKLSLCSIWITDEGVNDITRSLKALQSLCLLDCPRITDAALVHISENASQLRIVQMLYHSHLTSAGVRALSTCKELREVRFSIVTGVDDEGIVALCNSCTKLQNIMVPGSRITDAAVTAAMQLKDLTELDVSQCPRLTAESAAVIARAAPQNLAKLSMEGMMWVRNSHVSGIISACTGLREFFVADCDFVTGTTIRVNTNPHLRVHLSSKTISMF